MSIGMNKKCVSLLLCLFFKYVLLIFLIFAGVFFFTQCPSEEIKVDRDTYDEHSNQYITDIRHFFESDEYRGKYENITYKEEELYNEDYRKNLTVYFNKTSTLYISINYYNNVEKFSVYWYIDVDEYGAGKSEIDWDIITGILNIVSGYPFTEEKLSNFVENALENNIVNYESYRDYYKISDNESINFMGDWSMYYSVQENNSDPNVQLPKYKTNFTVIGLTKTGMKP